MTFEQWLAANKYDAEKLTPDQRKHLEAAWKAETQPAPQPASAPAPAPQPAAVDFAAEAAKIEANSQRIAAIRQMTLQWMARHNGNPEKQAEIKGLALSAEQDEKTTVQAFELAMIRADRLAGPMILAPRQQQVTEQVLEAAVCVAGGLPNVEAQYKPETLDAAHRHYRHGLSLGGLISHFARKNGWRGHDIKSDLRGALKAAFRGGDDGGMHAGDIGASTYDISGILSNIANKFVKTHFEFTEQKWREISAIRPVNDFKTITSYTLTGDLTYEEVPAGGEIKHGSLGEVSYTNRADTYGKLIGIDRRDLINDDLGALSSVGRRLGRGAGLKLNDVFWAEFLDDAAFFDTDNSKGNYLSGETALFGAAALDLAYIAFMQQTDPDGKPLGVMPRRLLVPIALETASLRLMRSVSDAAGDGSGDDNPWAGKFAVTASLYLTTAGTWYLLADPMDLPVIEVCFLNGQQMPTVETADMDFDRLGIAMRGFHDFGVSKQEYRAGVKNAGS